MGGLPDIGSGGVAGIIVALTGAITAFIGWQQARAGRKTEVRNDAARVELERDQQELVERRYTDEQRDRIIDRLNAEIERERTTGEHWFERYKAAEGRADQARKRADRYREQLLDVAQVVRDETIRAAVVDGVTDDDVPHPPDPEP